VDGARFFGCHFEATEGSGEICFIGLEDIGREADFSAAQRMTNKKIND